MFGRELDETAAIHNAAISGDVDVIRSLLAAGVNVECKNTSGQTPLHLAARGGMIKAVEFLLGKTERRTEEKALLPYEKMGYTALHYAAIGGHADVIKRFIGAEINLNQQCVGEYSTRATALHLVAQKGSVDAVKLLIDAGADVSILRSDGSSALHLATQKGSVEAVKLLIEAGADVSILRSDGSSALHLAAQEGSVEAVKLLIEAGADVNKKEGEGYTPLDMAIKQGNKESITFLKEVLEVQNAEAIVQRRKLPHPDEKVCMGHLYRKFQEKLSSLEGEESERERSHQKLIVRVCKVYNLNTRKKIHPFEKVYESVQLYLAMKPNRDAKIRSLLGKVPYEIGKYILRFAYSKKFLHVMRDVADADYDEHGQTELHRLVKKGDAESVEALLKVNEGSLNIQDFSGNTPLHLAALKGDHTIVKILASREDSDVEILNDDKKTAKQIIVESGNGELLAAFEAGRSEAVKASESTKRGRKDNEGKGSDSKRPRIRHGAVPLPGDGVMGANAGGDVGAAMPRVDAGGPDGMQPAAGAGHEAMMVRAGAGGDAGAGHEAARRAAGLYYNQYAAGAERGR